MTGALFQYVVWWWEKIGYRSDRDARNVTGRDDTTITNDFAIDVIIIIIIIIIIVIIIIMIIISLVFCFNSVNKYQQH